VETIMDTAQKLKKDYPWIQTPLVVSAPMRLITLAESAVEVSKAGMYTSLHLSAQRRALMFYFNPIVFAFLFLNDSWNTSSEGQKISSASSSFVAIQTFVLYQSS
jgi:hypothetical protein